MNDKVQYIPRDSFADVFKGIAIILMVIGHCGCPQFLHDYIYLFHMPLFFFISGYLFKYDYVNQPMAFVKRRLKSCYLPFVKFSFIFLLFHELLVPLGFTNSYSLPQYLHKIIMVLILTETDPFVGSFWFLIEMLVSSVIFILFSFLLSRLKYGGERRKMLLLIAISIIAISIFGIFQIHIPKISIRSFEAVIYMALGYLARSFKFNPNGWSSILSLVILAFILNYCPIHLGSLSDGGMDIHNHIDAFVYLIVSQLGLVGIFGMTKMFCKSFLSPILSLAGRSSLGILTWHCFTIAILVNFCACLFPEIKIDYCLPLSISSLWFVISIFSLLLAMCMHQLYTFCENSLTMQQTNRCH